MRSVSRIAAATVLVVVAVCVAAETASARVVQTIGNTGQLRLRVPQRVALGPSGLLYVLDSGGGSSPVLIRVYSPAGRLLRSWRIATQSDPVPDMVVDSVGDAYVVARPVGEAGLEYSILKYSPTGKLVTARWGAVVVDGQIDYPVLAADGHGHILIARYGRIETFDGAGRLLTSWQYAAPEDSKNRINSLAVATSGMIYVADRKGIALLDSSGNVGSRVVPAGDRPGQVSWPRLIAGPAGSLYAVQSGIQADRIQKFGPDGRFLGAVGSDRHVQWLSAAVAGDGSIYVPQGFGNGVVLKLAPITTVDVTPPSITVDPFSPAPIKSRPRDRAKPVLGRLTYTLSEDSSFRISLKRRAATKDRRNRDFGRYLYIATLSEGVTPAGTHTLALDWRSFNYDRPFPGAYQLALVARDDAGNESVPARVSFSIARP